MKHSRLAAQEKDGNVSDSKRPGISHLLGPNVLEPNAGVKSDGAESGADLTKILHDVNELDNENFLVPWNHLHRVVLIHGRSQGCGLQVGSRPVSIAATYFELIFLYAELHLFKGKRQPQRSSGISWDKYEEGMTYRGYNVNGGY